MVSWWDDHRLRSNRSFEPLLDDGSVWKMRAPEDRIGLHAEQFISAKDYINAQRIRRVIARELDKLLGAVRCDCDAGRSSVAPPIDRPFVNTLANGNIRSWERLRTPRECLR